MTRSVWSGGVKWGPVTSGVVAKWMPDGAGSPSGRPVPDFAIGGAMVLGQLQSAQWGLGQADWLADLGPNTGSFTFAGQVTAQPGDDIVVTTDWGTMWVGRVDRSQETRSVDGLYRTTVTATDRVGALGRAQLRKSKGKIGTLKEIAETMSQRSGIPLTVTDASVGTYGLVQLQWWQAWSMTFTGSLLDYLNIAARSSNAMTALQPDGSLKVMTREALPSPPTTTTLSGINSPSSWTKTLAWGNDVNSWSFTWPDGNQGLGDVKLTDDILAHGERSFSIDSYLDVDAGLGIGLPFLDWWAYTPAVREVVTSGTFVVRDLSQEELLTLAPLDWIEVDGIDWQVMSMAWSIDGPGEPMRLTITADNILERISGISSGGTGPVISNVAAAVGDTTATITWDLDQPGTGFVQYGLTTDYGMETTHENSYTYSSHVQTIEGLLPGQTYHYRVRSAAPQSAPIETIGSDGTFTTTATTAATIYGIRVDGDQLANTRFSATLLKQFMRFRAEQSSQVTDFRFYYVGPDSGAGYGGGTGGIMQLEFQTDDGSADHLPSGQRIGSAVQIPAAAIGDAGKLITIPAGPTLVAGTLYHAVLSNIDAAPATNYGSPDYWFFTQLFSGDRVADGLPPASVNPGYSWADLGHGYFESGVWNLRDGFVPIFDLGYANGKSQGQGYMEACYGSSTTRAKVTGTNFKGRERIIVTETPRTISKVAVRAHHAVGNTDALQVDLCDASMSVIDTVNLPAASFVGAADPGSAYDGEDARYVEGSFSGSHILALNTTYYVLVSCAGTSTYWVFGTRKGTSQGYRPSTYFADGLGQYTTNGSTWNDITTQSGATGLVDLRIYLS